MTAAGPAMYVIRVDGHLGDHWISRLSGMTLERADDGTTTLSGAVADQSQLHAVLAGVRDIGATLLDLRRESP